MRYLIALHVTACLLLGTTSSTEQRAAEAAIEKQAFSMLSLINIERKVAKLQLPLPISKVISTLGGESLFTFSSAREINGVSSTLILSFREGLLKDTDYVVELESKGSVSDGERLITKVRVGYRVPLGGVFYADLEELQRESSDLKKLAPANQSPEPTR